MKFRLQSGMTLLEIMVVVSIIAILAVFIVGVLMDSTAQSRDAQRQADIQMIKNAIELYRQENGRYPEGCNGADAWSGEPGSDYACGLNTGNEYIKGIAPKYIRTLPNDPNPNGSDSGYAYKVDSLGSVYKFVVFRTVEVESVVQNGQVTGHLSSLKLCDLDGSNDTEGDGDELCVRVSANANNTPAHCNRNHVDYRTSYAVWGGYNKNPIINNVQKENRTENITCDIPDSPW